MAKELTKFTFDNDDAYNRCRDKFSQEYGSGYQNNNGWTFDNQTKSVTINDDIADEKYASKYCRANGGNQE